MDGVDYTLALPNPIRNRTSFTTKLLAVLDFVILTQQLLSLAMTGVLGHDFAL